MRLLLLVAVLSLAAGCGTPADPDPRPPRTDRPETGLPRRAAESPEPPPLIAPAVLHLDFALLRVGMSKGEVLDVFPGPLEIDTTTRGLDVWHYEFAQLLFRDGFLENWFNLRADPPPR